MAGAGVGEAALLGAVMGGGSAMLTGADPLKGALMGTLTGGIGGAVSPALNALTTTAAPLAATTAVTSMAPTMANAAFLNSAQSAAGNAAINGAIKTALPLTGDLGIAGLANSVMAPAVPSAFTPLVTGAAPVATIPMASAIPPADPPVDDSFLGGIKKFANNPMSSLMENKFTAAGSALAGASQKKKKEEEEEYSGPLSRFKYNPDAYRPAGYADGGIANLDSGGYDRMVGEQPMYMSNMAYGGIANLGSYSDGGRMLKGPGDGMSDNIPATIAGKRPARLADGEFVIPADVVSHLGNGSTDAGAKQLYAMMAKVRKARTGSKAQGREINPRQYMAA